MKAYLFDTTSNFFVEANTLVTGPSYLSFAFLLFISGLFGMLFNYKNFLVTILSIEIIYLGAISSFILYGTIANNPFGAIYGLILLILAACESGIGLGILIVLYRFGNTIELRDYQHLHG